MLPFTALASSICLAASFAFAGEPAAEADVHELMLQKIQTAVGECVAKTESADLCCSPSGTCGGSQESGRAARQLRQSTGEGTDSLGTSGSAGKMGSLNGDIETVTAGMVAACKSGIRDCRGSCSDSYKRLKSECPECTENEFLELKSAVRRCYTVSARTLEAQLENARENKRQAENSADGGMDRKAREQKDGKTGGAASRPDTGHNPGEIASGKAGDSGGALAGASAASAGAAAGAVANWRDHDSGGGTGKADAPKMTETHGEFNKGGGERGDGELKKRGGWRARLNDPSAMTAMQQALGTQMIGAPSLQPQSAGVTGTILPASVSGTAKPANLQPAKPAVVPGMSQAALGRAGFVGSDPHATKKAVSLREESGAGRAPSSAGSAALPAASTAGRSADGTWKNTNAETSLDTEKPEEFHNEYRMQSAQPVGQGASRPVSPPPPTLADYLPTGRLYHGPHVGGASEPDQQIQSQAADIWNLVTTRIRYRCKIGGLYDCR